VKGFFENPSEVKPKLCGPLSSQLEYLSKPSVEQGKPTLSLVSRPFPTPKTLAFGKSNWQRKDLGLSSAILDQSNDGIIQRTVIQSPETPTGSRSTESTPFHNGLRAKHGSSFLQALGLNMLTDDGTPGSPTTSIFRSPFLLGPYRAEREYSPPFGGSPSFASTSFEGALPSVDGSAFGAPLSVANEGPSIESTLPSGGAGLP